MGRLYGQCPGFADLFGDDIAGRAAMIEGRNPFHNQRALSEPLTAYIRPLAQSHCEATVEMAGQLGLSPAVAAGAQDLFEKWDGSGIPAGRRGELEIYSRVLGLSKALQLIEAQAGRHYSPLQSVIGVVERRQTMPVLANVLLSARENRLSITGTDLEVELVATSMVNVAQGGDITVPGRKLLDIFKALPEQASVTLSTEGERIVVKAGRSRFTHVENLYRKLGVSIRAAAALIASKWGLVN